jgi:hypothetical protein
MPDEMQELGGLYGFVLMLVLIGMILGIGILIFDKFGSATYNTVTITNDTVTWLPNADEALDHGNITSFTSLVNGTSVAVPSSNYTVYNVNGSIAMLDNSTTMNETMTAYATYTYKEYATTTQSTMSSMVTTTSPIATTWLPLIVTIVILAIILTIVIRSFAQTRR